MGNRLAPMLAILGQNARFKDRIENQAIYSDQALSLPLCYRYIDDCITPASGPDEAVKIQDKLNSQDPSIRFEIELPGKDGFLHSSTQSQGERIWNRGDGMAYKIGKQRNNVECKITPPRTNQTGCYR